MALIVEDGSGKVDAESYVSVADCAAYAVSHGLAFTGDEPAKEARLRRATQYIDAQYAFKGEEQTDTQALAWPRTVAIGVPREIVSACCELACKSGDLWQDVDPSAVVSETIGPLSTTYAEPANGGQVRYAAVDALLKRWVSGGGMSVRVVRA